MPFRSATSVAYRALALATAAAIATSAIAMSPQAARALSLGPLTLASLSDDELAGDGQSGDDRVAISDDGSVVAFLSEASNLVTGDSNGQRDVFVRDITAGTTERINVGPGGVEADDLSFQPSISGDGRYVAFSSWATTLVDASSLGGADTNLSSDAFVYDRVTDTLERVSLSADEIEGDLESVNPVVSADGRFVAFLSAAQNLAATPANTSTAIYVRDRLDGTTIAIQNEVGTCHSVGGPVMSPDATWIAYEAIDSDCAGNTSPGIYLYDVAAGTYELVSLGDDETPATHLSGSPAISADGRFVAFQTVNQLSPDDTDGQLDVFLRDRTLGTTERMSISMSGGNLAGTSYDPAFSVTPSVSDDGRYVAFGSNGSNLVPGDQNNEGDVFVRDRFTDSTVRVSVRPDGTEAGGSCGGCGHAPDLSPDGTKIAFLDTGSLVAEDDNSTFDVYVRDLTPAPSESTADSVSAGGTLTTDSEADGTSGSDPIETTITSPNGGTVSITESPDPSSTPAPTGYAFLGGAVTIEAPLASIEDPLSISFTIDTTLTGGIPVDAIVVFRDGEPILNCDVFPPDPIDPDPCISLRAINDGGDPVITVLTSHASEWAVGVVAPVDDAGPTVTITTPTDGATYAQGSTVLADYQCSDGSGVGACNGNVSPGAPIDTSSEGTQSFTVFARDELNNWTQTTVTYEVSAATYHFSGFYQPIDNTSLNRAKAGSGIPVKFSLGGDFGLDIFAAGYPSVSVIACPGLTVDAIEQTVAIQVSFLSYNASTDRYTYQFRTSKSWAGSCRRLELLFNDGTSKTADFQFVR
jgi:Tol biopolymer transport system component